MKKLSVVLILSIVLFTMSACNPDITTSDVSDSLSANESVDQSEISESDSIDDSITESSVDETSESGDSLSVVSVQSTANSTTNSSTPSSSSSNSSVTSTAIVSKIDDGDPTEVTIPEANISGQKISIMSWAPVDDPSVIRYKSVFKRLFGATIEWQYVSWADYASTFTTRSMANNPPDVFSSRNEDYPIMIYKGLCQQIDGKFDFNSPLWKDIKARNDMYKHDNKMFGIVTSAWVGRYVWYNKNILINEGQPDLQLLYSQNKWDWDTLVNIGKAVTKDTNKSGQINQYGLSSNAPAIISGILLASHGVDLVKKVSGKYTLNFDDPKVTESMSYLYDIYNTHQICPNQTEDSLNLFAQGKLAMYIDGSWIGTTDPVKTLHKQGRVAYVPVPKLKGASESIQWAENTRYVIPKGSKVNVDGAVALINMFRYLSINKTELEKNNAEMKSIGYTDVELAYSKDVIKATMSLDYIGFGAMANEVYLAGNEVAGGTPWMTVKEIHEGPCRQAIDEINGYAD